MTERALPGMDGAPACPFVAFGDDREGRSTSPDHRHRCFAESPPAPRAVAHQEAYCLSSAFPVCPTFQDWARREAAHARGAGERPESAPSAVASSVVPSAAQAGLLDFDDLDDSYPAPSALPTGDDPPIRRNPPRDWAAPPPWAMGATGPGGTGQTARPAGSSPGAPGDPAGARSGVPAPLPEGQGLAGSPADRLAMGAVAPAAAWSASAAGTVATPPDDELAGLVQGRSDPSPPRHTSDAYPPSTRAGRRPSVSSTRPTGDPVPGPTWERIRRYEAYPTIKTRARLPGLSRLAVLGGAVAIAALALFMLPALLGIGGGGSASPKPSGSRPAATAVSSPTVPPAPTPQVYVIKQGDNLLKVAKTFGLTLDELLAANPQITNPNKIGLGQEIVIPAPGSGSSAKPSASAKASGSAAH
jgi:hypothetical protein